MVRNVDETYTENEIVYEIESEFTNKNKNKYKYKMKIKLWIKLGGNWNFKTNRIWN